MPPTSSPDDARSVFRACPLCEATCGITVQVANNRAVAVKGDADDPLSRGYLCPKAHGLIGLQDDPDRLRRPVRREGSRFIEIGWNEAFELATSKLRALREAHGPGALAAYAGNPTVHDFGATLFMPALMRSLSDVTPDTPYSIRNRPSGSVS